MPDILEMLSEPESTKVFTTIDLSLAYHQILFFEERVKRQSEFCLG